MDSLDHGPTVDNGSTNTKRLAKSRLRLDLVGADVLLGITQAHRSAIEVATSSAIALAFQCPQKRKCLPASNKTCSGLASPRPASHEEQLKQILHQLQQSSLIQRPDDALQRPLVLDHHHLYLQRMWSYETQLVTDLLRIAQRSKAPRDLSSLTPIICALFPTSSIEAPTPQHRAAGHFINSPFTVLTGGPGTGKTWTLRNALTLEFIARKRCSETADLPPPVAILAAPTGKAAARMKDSIIKKLDEHLEKLTPFLACELMSLSNGSVSYRH